MIVEEIQGLLAEYRNWLQDKTVLQQVNGDLVEITTPHLDRHNDFLQIYARKDGNGYVLTDDGYIISDLANSGCKLDTPKRQQLLQMTLAGFGVRVEAEQLFVHATPENFPLRKHNMIQAMLAVNDLFYLASPHVESLFLEDVTRWLDLADIRYTPRIKLVGKSGYDHMFNFVIPKSRQQPERLLQALSNPKKDAVEALVFKWIDTRDAREDDSLLVAVLNDANNISPDAIDAMHSYGLKPVLWSQREQAQELLAA